MSELKDLLVIICGTSGSQEDVAPVIEKVLKPSKFSYQIKQVKIPPDITKVIDKEAKKFKAVAVYGGDGSITTALKALAGSSTKLLVLPGGTGNIIATDLGVPMNPTDLIAMYVDGRYATDSFDLADVNGKKLALDMHIGWWAKATANTPRELKKKIGQIAYGLSALKTLASVKKTNFELTVDGRRVTTAGYTAVIANRGAQIFLGVQLFPQKHRTGVVRVAIVRSLSPASFLLWIVARSVTNKNVGKLLKTYKGNEIVITKAPRELLYDDLELQLKLPSTIIGNKYETKLIVPVSEQKVSGFSKRVLSFKLIGIRLKERIRNFRTGQPSYALSQLAPHVYVGGQYKTKAYQQFKKWGVTGIINMRSTVPTEAPPGFEILHLKTQDWTPPKLQDLSRGVAFAKARIAKGEGVYIHCRQGEGRGPTMAAAYLISQGLSIEEALAQIEKSRPMARPNRLQIKRLAEWQSSL